MAALLEAWNESGVRRAEKMFSTSIGLKLDKNESEMGKSKVANFEEKQAFVLEQPKVDEVEEDQSSVPSKKH